MIGTDTTSQNLPKVQHTNAMEGEAPDRDDVPSHHGSAEESEEEDEYEAGNYYDEDDPHFQMLLKLGYGKHRPENINNDHSHENHGHPKLTDPDKEYWMMWEEWDPGVLRDHQETLMLQFEILTRPEITAFYQLDAERRGRLGKIHDSFFPLMNA